MRCNAIFYVEPLSVIRRAIGLRWSGPEQKIRSALFVYCFGCVLDMRRFLDVSSKLFLVWYL